MPKDCPILNLAGAIGEAVNDANTVEVSSRRSANYHNNGTCMEAQCAWWVGDTPETSACVFVKSVQKQSAIVKVLDFINICIRDLQQVVRARL